MWTLSQAFDFSYLRRRRLLVSAVIIAALCLHLVLLTGEEPQATSCSRHNASQSFIPEKSDGRMTASHGGQLALKPQRQGLDLCPRASHSLLGRLRVNFTPASWEELGALFPHLEAGGHGSPSGCRARQRVALVVPFRQRDEHLRVLLRHLVPLLSRQRLDFALVVVEQADGETFNRGKLLNVGAVEALRLYSFDCLVLHDVDLLPEDDRNDYACPAAGLVRHMSSLMDKYDYAPPYPAYFGGVVGLTPEDFRRLNGLSSDFWGWGGEDDDLGHRVAAAGLGVERPSRRRHRYKMFRHQRDQGNRPNQCRKRLLREARACKPMDGLSSLSYTLLSRTFRPTHVHLRVTLHEATQRQHVDRFCKAFPSSTLN